MDEVAESIDMHLKGCETTIEVDGPCIVDDMHYVEKLW